MPDQLQLRGGTTTEHNSFTGAAREVTVDTTKKTLVVHDGSQAGGTPLMKESGGNAATSVGIGTGGTNAININSSQKVGIGTASPARKLEVHDTNATVLALNSTNSSGTTLRIQNGGTDKIFLGLAGDFITGQSANVTDSAIRASGALLFATGGGSERMRLTSSGNVGIGTTSPNELLEVTGNCRLSSGGATRTLHLGSHSAGIEYNVNGTTFIQGRTDAYPLAFKTNSSERMRIDSSGRLLLGTTTEGHSNADDLTVASSADTGITIRSGSSSQSSLYFSDATSGTGEYVGSVAYNHSSNSLFLATSSSNKLAIDSSGNLTFSLEAASGYPTQQIKWSNDSTTTNGFYIAQHSDRNGRIWHEQGLSLVFGTSNQERMAIHPDGMVLLGLSSTLSSNNAKLQVAHTDGNADIIVHRAGDNANPPSLNFQKTRNATVGNYGTVVQVDDELGSIRWGGADGSNIGFAARIVGVVDASPSANDMAGRLQFHTSKDGSESLTERTRITSKGEFEMGNHLGSGNVLKQISRASGNTSETITATQLGLDDNNYALIWIVVSGTELQDWGHSLISWRMGRGSNSVIVSQIDALATGSGVSTFTQAVSGNSLVIGKDSDLDLNVTVIGGGGRRTSIGWG